MRNGKSQHARWLRSARLLKTPEVCPRHEPREAVVLSIGRGHVMGGLVATESCRSRASGGDTHGRASQYPYLGSTQPTVLLLPQSVASWYCR